MRIIVFVKQVKYLYAQTGADPKQNFVGPDDIIHILNPLDELAVEEALRVKERRPSVEVIVISMGDRFVEEGLRRCLSMGADRAIHIHEEQYEKMDAWVTAAALVSSVRNLPFDLILCGREAIDTQDGLVGPYIAELLKIPHLSKVVRLDIDETGKRVLLHRAVERGNREVMECAIPALFTVERGINTPRYPTVPGILRAQHQPIENVELRDLALSIEPLDSTSHLTEMVRLSIPKPKARARSPEDSKRSASDRLQLLMKGKDVKKKEDSKVLDGNSEDAFDELEHILKENGIIFG